MIGWVRRNLTEICYFGLFSYWLVHSLVLYFEDEIVVIGFRLEFALAFILLGVTLRELDRSTKANQRIANLMEQIHDDACKLNERIGR